jgi:hypothetical protein
VGRPSQSIGLREAIRIDALRKIFHVAPLGGFNQVWGFVS